MSPNPADGGTLYPLSEMPSSAVKAGSMDDPVWNEPILPVQRAERQPKRAAWIALVLVLVVGIDGGATWWAISRRNLSLPSSRQTPLQETTSWFQAVDAKDLSAARAHFVAWSGSDMNSNDGDTSQWPTFADIHCRNVGHQSNSTAVVYCTFNQSPVAGKQTDAFWTVSLQRNGAGPWLINNYGQG